MELMWYVCALANTLRGVASTMRSMGCSTGTCGSRGQTRSLHNHTLKHTAPAYTVMNFRCNYRAVSIRRTFNIKATGSKWLNKSESKSLQHIQVVHQVGGLNYTPRAFLNCPLMKHCLLRSEWICQCVSVQTLVLLTHCTLYTEKQYKAIHPPARAIKGFIWNKLTYLTGQKWNDAEVIGL